MNTTPCNPSYRQLRGRRSCAGVTLIEILVVTAIVTVIATLVLLAFRSVQNSVGAAKCAGNLRQIAAAGLNWIADNGGTLPDRSQWTRTLDGNSNSHFSLFSYLGIPRGKGDQDSVLTCPTLRAKYLPYNPPTSVIRDWHRTYGINQFTVGTVGGDPNHELMEFSYRRLVAVPHPSKVAFFFDGPVARMDDSRMGLFNQVFEYPYFRSISETASNILGSDYIHGGAINVVFLDGHVERITPERVAEENLSEKTNPFWGRKP